MLKGKNDFALNFGLLRSPDLSKPDAPATVHYFVTERGGFLGHETGLSPPAGYFTNHGHTKQLSGNV